MIHSNGQITNKRLRERSERYDLRAIDTGDPQYYVENSNIIKCDYTNKDYKSYNESIGWMYETFKHGV